ncbi:MAG: hypothetical protein Q8T08_08705 [Ignavibacteria bacterium]|nr:hypothetical protein [Ignavibacteria bacterium]
MDDGSKLNSKTQHMKHINENELESLLKDMRPIKAPEGISENVMLRLQQTQAVSTDASGITLEKLLLGFSLLAGLIAIFFVTDLSFINNLLSKPFEFTQIALNFDKGLINSIINFTVQLPTLAILSFVSIIILLLTERFIFRKIFRFYLFV